MSNPTQRSRNTKPALAEWMQEVLKQSERVAQGFATDPVHDLRVAIRRCRSIAEGLRAIDPDPRWKKMRRSAKELFASLGRLRDAQVMMEWIEKLAPAEDPATGVLIAYCQAQEQSLKQEAELVLDAFDRRQWQSWAESLPSRASRIPLGSEPFTALALERWAQARRIHNSAMRTGRQATFHRLRIGIKKFRYVIEHFLPELHEQWSQGLKHFQDLLGEVQDLTVLWETALRIGALNDPETRERWKGLVVSEREARIERYRLETENARDSLWHVWRSGLPHSQEAKEAALKKLQVWASFLDPDVRHSRRVARIAMQIHEGLVRLDLIGSEPNRSRELLRAATSVIGVGRSNRGKERPKRGERMIQRVERPFAWKRQDLAVIATIARLHRGPLPDKPDAGLQRFPPPLARFVERLAGIVRLANALAFSPDGAEGRVTVQRARDFLVVSVEHLPPKASTGESVAAARYMLEISLRMPILIQAKKSPKPRQNKGLSRGNNRQRRG